MVYSFLITLVIATFLALFSLAVLTYGYALLRTLVPVIAFVYGMLLTTHGISLFFGESFLSGVLAFIPAFIVGVVLALLASELYDIFVILIGASFGWFAVSYGFASLGISGGFWIYLVSFLASVIVGIYFITVQAFDYVEFFMASAVGATLLCLSVFMLITKVGVSDLSVDVFWSMITSSIFWIMLWIAVFLFGMISQFYSKIYNG